LRFAALTSPAPDHKIAVSVYWHHWEKARQNARNISELVMRRAREVLLQQQPASLDD